MTEVGYIGFGADGLFDGAEERGALGGGESDEMSLLSCCWVRQAW